MSDDGGDVNPTSPRPKGYYERFRDSPWYYVNNELAQAFILGPVIDAEPGDDWVPPFTGGGTTGTDRERACIRLTPRVSHELYIEMKDLPPDVRQTGHAAECDLCGESVPLERAVPNKREELAHKHCCVDAYGGSVRMEDYRVGSNQ